MRAMLEPFVREVVMVKNGEEAVDAIRARDFDIVLMDKQMPVMDGIAATQAIRRLDPPKRAIPIIAITADAFAGAEQLCIEHAMDGYVTKPVNRAELHAEITAAASSRRYAAAS